MCNGFGDTAVNMPEGMFTPAGGGDTPSGHPRQEAKTRVWLVGAVFALLVALAVAGVAVGGEFGQLMLAGAESLPLMVLAMLAYLGATRSWAKLLTLLWLLVLVLVAGLFTLALSLEALPKEGASDAAAGVAGEGVKRATLLLGLALSPLVGAAGFLRPVRRVLSRLLPIDPNSFVHAVALATVVTLTLIGFVPLLALSTPPLLSTVADLTAEGRATGGRSSWGMLRDDLYGLVWMLPATIFAVGFGIRRSLRGSLARLGLVRPTRRQLLAGLGLGVGLMLAMHGLGMGIDWLWAQMGWIPTDEDAFHKLMAYTMSPTGALVTGVTAGLGEELAVRGVLQPRLGILLSNLFFTGLHALQYSWDALLIVFLLGLVMGIIRRRSNTTTSAVVHGSYDFCVIMVDVLQIPGLS